MISVELILEWHRHFEAALRFKSRNPRAIADILTYGSTQERRND
jgi:hypothetical protein